jgi:hypothetical protein
VKEYTADDKTRAFAKLREPFPPAMIGKLPRVTCKACSQKSCDKHQKTKCQVCSAFITTAHIHLDFVGHAELTDRLLTVDPEWNWEPVAFGEDGLPRISDTPDGPRLWIRLTIVGVTRLGVGSVERGAFDIEKQLIGDALRNAAMRFGVALDLWAKSDLASQQADNGAEEAHAPTTTRRAPPRRPSGTNGSGEPSEPATGASEAPEGDPAQMTSPELTAALKAAGLSVDGTKSQRLLRLVEHRQGVTPTELASDEAPEPSARRFTSAGITEAQVTKVSILFAEKGLADTKHQYMSDFFGRHIESTKDLDKVEGAELITELESLPVPS